MRDGWGGEIIGGIRRNTREAGEFERAMFVLSSVGREQRRSKLGLIDGKVYFYFSAQFLKPKKYGSDQSKHTFHRLSKALRVLVTISTGPGVVLDPV